MPTAFSLWGAGQPRGETIPYQHDMSCIQEAKIPPDETERIESASLNGTDANICATGTTV